MKGSSYRSRTDAELVAAALEGDERAFQEIYERYRRGVQRFVVKRIGDESEAEDVTQDVFLEVHRSLASYAGRAKLATWIFGIAHHRVLRQMGQRRRRAALALDAPETPDVRSPEPSPDERADATRLLERCLELLESEVVPAARQVFRLRYAEGASVRQVARQLGASPNAIKCSLRRTRRMLDEHTRDLRVPVAC
jgi:RNA polymerase sigma-70 factor (ECF subfamily)